MYHNIPKSILDISSSILAKEDSQLPELLVESAKLAAGKIKNVMTLEDKRNILREHYEDAIKRAKLEHDQNMMIRFERAVEILRRK